MLQCMKKGVTAVLLLGFIGVAVFGFVAMMHEDGHGHDGCVAATAQATACPMNFSPLSIPFHMDTFKAFSTAIPSAGLFAILALLAIFINALAANAARGIFVSSYATGYDHLLSAEASSSIRALHQWLARLENSPSLSS